MVQIITVNAQDMKGKKLLNGDIIYDLTEKEEASVINDIYKYEQLRKDTIPDLIYGRSPSILILYRTSESKLLFDYGGVKFCILDNEKTYDYFLKKDKTYQIIHSFDFITFKAFEVFVSEIDKLFFSFCQRKGISRDKVSLQYLKQDISGGSDIAQINLQQQIAAFCYLKIKQGFHLDCVKVFGSDDFCAIILKDKNDKIISPTKWITKIYEDNYLK